MDPQVWTIIGFAVAGLVLIAVGLVRLALEGKRLQTRVKALLERPPAIDFDAAAADVARLSLSLNRLTVLGARAIAALGRIRAQFALLNRLVRGFPGPT